MATVVNWPFIVEGYYPGNVNPHWRFSGPGFRYDTEGKLEITNGLWEVYSQFVSAEDPSAKLLEEISNAC